MIVDVIDILHKELSGAFPDESIYKLYTSDIPDNCIVLLRDEGSNNDNFLGIENSIGYPIVRIYFRNISNLEVIKLRKSVDSFLSNNVGVSKDIIGLRRLNNLNFLGVDSKKRFEYMLSYRLYTKE